MYYTQAVLVVSLLTLLWQQWRHKKRMQEQELKMLHQRKELQLLQLLTQGEQEERSRIAKELHDGVAGILAAAQMQFSSMPAASELAQAESYRRGMQLLNEATLEIRKTSHILVPEVLLQHGLDEALLRCCHNLNIGQSLQIQYDSLGEIGRFHHSFELAVFRVLQQLLNKTIKLSGATLAIVQLSRQNDVLSVSIEDNGIHFRKHEESRDGMSLLSLQSRVNALNGKLELESSQQSGLNAYLEFEIGGWESKPQ